MDGDIVPIPEIHTRGRIAKKARSSAQAPAATQASSARMRQRVAGLFVVILKPAPDQFRKESMFFSEEKNQKTFMS
jgi:hypothetical protein